MWRDLSFTPSLKPTCFTNPSPVVSLLLPDCLRLLSRPDRFFSASRFLLLVFPILRSTPSSRPNSMCLKCPSVRPSTKSLFDFNEIWCVGRGRRVMHDGMQYDPIQGEGQGHEPLKVGNSAIFKGYLLPHLQWGLANDHGFFN